jgi:hypothetical protein
MAQIYHTATEYAANALTFLRGDPADVTAVGVYHDVNPATVPEVGDFTTVTLISDDDDPLAEGDFIDVLSLIGVEEGADETLTAGDYQRWVCISTATERIIRKVDVLEVL